MNMRFFISGNLGNFIRGTEVLLLNVEKLKKPLIKRKIVIKGTGEGCSYNC